MESTKDNVKGRANFKWTNEYYKIFCELLIKFIRKNGRGSFSWVKISEEFEAIIKQSCKPAIVKHKYDCMKTEWRLWRFLKFSETGLGWDPVTGKLNCLDEWWERKIKEEPKAAKFRNKPVDPSLEELWRQLFEDNYATGENVVAPSMDPDYARRRQQVNVNVEDEANETGECNAHHVYGESSGYAYRVDNLSHEEHAFFSDFAHELGYTEVPRQGGRGTEVPNQGDRTSIPTQTQNMSNQPTKRKRQRRQSGGATKLSSQIDTLVSNSSTALEILKSDDSVNKDTSASSTIEAAMSVINCMVDECILEQDSELWCFAVSLIENEARREIFLNIGNNASRKTWLKYRHDKGE